MWDVRNTEESLRMSNGIYPTQALFYEFGNKDALYTLKSRDVTKDGKVYLSIYKIYMESVDEYEAALRLVGDMGHWRKLCALKWFTEGLPHFSWEGLTQLRNDMAARDKSEAKKKLIQASNDGNVNAAKILYGDSPKQTTGRKPKNNLSKVESEVENSILNNIAKLRASDG